MNKSMIFLTVVALVACDVVEETETRVGEGYVGVGLEIDDEGEGAEAALAFDELSAAADPSAAGYCDSVATWNSTFASFETQVITLVNQRRAAGANCGGTIKPAVGAVALSTKLRCAARKHSKDMGVNVFTSHTGSNGSSPWDRIHAAGYSYSNAAENIAWGYSTPQAVVDGWMASKPHCLNIMNGALTQLGVGYYKSSTSWKHYWTQDFGRPL
jgi:uncharacterized protein YkwD